MLHKPNVKYLFRIILYKAIKKSDASSPERGLVVRGLLGGVMLLCVQQRRPNVHPRGEFILSHSALVLCRFSV